MIKQSNSAMSKTFGREKFFNNYLGFASEPPEHVSGLSPTELSAEMLASRIFLKHRVRRNIRRMRHLIV